MSLNHQILEEKFARYLSQIEDNNKLNDNLRKNLNSWNSKNTDQEATIIKLAARLDHVEDKCQILEARLKETQKGTEEIPKLRESLKENSRDYLILDESVGKLKKSVSICEEKMEKGNSKRLSKNEKTLLDKLDVELENMKSKLMEIEGTVDHLNEITFEDFAKRFKKEIIETSETNLAKISREIKALDERTTVQTKYNDNIQKNIGDLKKKLDGEILKAQDLALLKDAEERWKINEDKLSELFGNLDSMTKRITQHDVELLSLNNNVFDYSFKEMAANFDERVDNRLNGLKKQIKELTESIQRLSNTGMEQSLAETIFEKVQKLVNNKLDCYTDSVDQKLIHINNTQMKPLEASNESLTGKKIIYMAGKRVVQPNQVIASVNGSYVLKNRGGGIPRKNQKSQNEPKKQKRSKSLEDTRKLTFKRSERNCNLAAEATRTRRQDYTQNCMYQKNCERAHCRFRHTKDACDDYYNCQSTACQKRHHPNRYVHVEKKQDIKRPFRQAYTHQQNQALYPQPPQHYPTYTPYEPWKGQYFPYARPANQPFYGWHLPQY